MHDSATILANLALDAISYDYGLRPLVSSVPSRLEGYLNTLKEEGYDCAKYRLGDIASTEEFRWDRHTLCELMSLLVDAGASASINFNGKSRILRLIKRNFFEQDVNIDVWAFEDLLYAFVQMGADVHALDEVGWTPSMTARYIGFWDEWCQALKGSGKDIEGVLRAEGNEWLLTKSWESILIERTGGHRHVYNRKGYNGSNAEDDIPGQDPEGMSRGEDESNIDGTDEDSDYGQDTNQNLSPCNGSEVEEYNEEGDWEDISDV